MTKRFAQTEMIIIGDTIKPSYKKKYIAAYIKLLNDEIVKELNTFSFLGCNNRHKNRHNKQVGINK